MNQPTPESTSPPTSASSSAPAPALPPAGEDVFQEGDPVELLGTRERSYFTVLRPGASHNVKGHYIPHDAVIGHPVGSRVRSHLGRPFHAMRPTLAEWIKRMSRFATVTYPKELGPIWVYADLFPGARVLEAGLGSGGLALAILRAIGPTGWLVSYENREESLAKGHKNVATWSHGTPPNHLTPLRDVYEGIAEEQLDRVLLDLSEPWRAFPHVIRALRPGGILTLFLPTVLQIHRAVNELRDARAFVGIEVLEVFHRRWHVGHQSVRPEHEMTGHTGFLVFARKVDPASWEEPGDAEASEGEDAQEASPAAPSRSKSETSPDSD